MRYMARVEYDGTDFAGFQVQPASRTVQGELEAALTRLDPEGSSRIEAAGRTDAGVHARGQVIAFTCRRHCSAAELGRALNATLPGDVALGTLRRVSTEFHPRTAARYREYRYTVWNGPHSPLHERYALGLRTPLDVVAMTRAGQVLVGRHDFSAFGVTNRSPIRTVRAVRVRRSGRTVTIDVAADAFLRGMVRRIVAVLLEVGQGKMGEQGVAAALVAGRPALEGAAAPARGLCLRRVVLGRPSRRDEQHGEHGER